VLLYSDTLNVLQLKAKVDRNDVHIGREILNLLFVKKVLRYLYIKYKNIDDISAMFTTNI
jgi:hypothetical protein